MGQEFGLGQALNTRYSGNLISYNYTQKEVKVMSKNEARKKRLHHPQLDSQSDTCPKLGKLFHQFSLQES